MKGAHWFYVKTLAAEMENRVARLRALSEDLRCAAEDSAGERCTGDRDVVHAHRVDDEDMP